MKNLNNIKLSSIERSTTIEGQSFPLHEFTSNVWADIIKPVREPKEGETLEETVKNNLNVIIIGIEGAGYEPTEEDREQIKTMLPNGVMREYMHRLCMLNDFGADTVKSAEKKYEAALLSDTK